jgi:hypothetical protein
VGNFSRDTFDRTRNYVAVRLQQGVPLVDADWNEQQDVTRNEAYEGLRTVQGDVALRGGLDVSPAGAGDDLSLSPGGAVVRGRPLQVWTAMRYSTQRYVDPAVAAADGVAVVQPVPIPPPPIFSPRVDTVYLDAFEREVASAEDPGLVNPMIGVETATRARREVVLRVAVGAAPPAPAAGHVHFPVAVITRFGGPIIAGQIVDVKPYPLPVGPREIAFAPWLQPVVGANASWTLAETFGAPPRLLATKPANVNATGVLPLDLPDGARLTRLRLRGAGTPPGATLFVKLARSRHDGSGAASVAEDTIAASAPFDRLVSTIPAEAVVDNTLNHYYLHVFAIGAAAEVRGGAVLYVP